MNCPRETAQGERSEGCLGITWGEFGDGDGDGDGDGYGYGYGDGDGDQLLPAAGHSLHHLLVGHQGQFGPSKVNVPPDRCILMECMCVCLLRKSDHQLDC